jgi:hypothetical protein
MAGRMVGLSVGIEQLYRCRSKKAVNGGTISARGCRHTRRSWRRVPPLIMPVHILHFRPSSDNRVPSHELTCLSVVMIS